MRTEARPDLGTVALVAAAVPLAGVALAQLLVPVRILHEHRPWLVAATCAAVLLLALTRLDARPARGGHVRPAALGAGAAALTSWALHHDVGWDAGALRWIAERLQHHEGLSPEQLAYLGHYPNNESVLAAHRLAVAWHDTCGMERELPTALVAAAACGVTVLLVGSLTGSSPGTVRSGATRTSRAAQVVTILLVACSPWTTVLYSDLLALAFPVAAVWSLCRATASQDLRGSLLWWGAAGALLGAGSVLKATVVLAAVAALPLFPRGPRRAGTALLVAALAAGSAHAATAAAAHQVAVGDVAVDEARAYPLERWVWLGLVPTVRPDGTTAPGVFTRAVDEEIGDRGTDEARALARDRIAERVGHLGPAGLVAWAADKTRWNLGDGTFWAYGEGTDARTSREAAGRAPAWQAPARALSTPGSPWAELRYDLTQGLWLALLLGAALSCLRVAAGRAAPDVRRLTLSLALVASAVVGYSVLMETRSRYVLVFVPLVAVLAAAAPRTSRRPTEPLRRSGTVLRCPPPD